MALINCPECKNEISNTATLCPSCGTPIAIMTLNSFWLVPFLKQIFFGTFLVFLFVFVPDKTSAEDGTYIAGAILLSYLPFLYIGKSTIGGKILPFIFYFTILGISTPMGGKFIVSLLQAQ